MGPRPWACGAHSGRSLKRYQVLAPIPVLRFTGAQPLHRCSEMRGLSTIRCMAILFGLGDFAGINQKGSINVK